VVEIQKTEFEGLLLAKPRVIRDDRGYFLESYNQKNMTNAGINAAFVQDNQSFSTFGTLRGLHFQKGEFAQSKLVRVVTGRVLDVALDLRPNSKTFKKYFTVELSAENFLELFIPKGFAHGFLVLSENAIVQYKCDAFYSPHHEGGVHYADPELNIQWPIAAHQLCVSSKDLLLPKLSDLQL
jgi:dTDP-4-dehydrorhamnose 3,5-epimerase